MTGSQDGQRSLCSSQPQILSLPMKGAAFTSRAALFPTTCLCVLTLEYQRKPITDVFPMNLIQFGLQYHEIVCACMQTRQSTFL